MVTDGDFAANYKMTATEDDVCALERTGPRRMFQ